MELIIAPSAISVFDQRLTVAACRQAFNIAKKTPTATFNSQVEATINMPAYIIVNIEITDPERYAEYIKVVPPTIAEFGGKYLARGGRNERLEGNYEPKRLVILQFDTYEKAKAWWSSDDYHNPKLLRQSASITDMILVDGI
jgi:uncharacterized protein (DUF1330 family)